MTALTACAVAAASVVTTLSTASVAATSAAQGSASKVVRAFEKHPFPTHEHGIDHPSGAAYVGSSGLLAIAESRPEGTAIALLRPQREQVVQRMTVPGLTDANTLADDGGGTLAALEGQTLITWPANAGGTAAVKKQTVEGQSLAGAAGMAYDPATHRWLVLDAARQRIVVLDARGRTPHATDGPSLAGLGATSLEGIAVDGSSRLTYVADPVSSELYAVTSDGSLHETFDVSDTDTTSMATLDFGATADPTDSAKETSLYMTQSGDSATFGQVSEMSLEPLGAGAAEAPTESTGTLVRASLLSELNPPSPDPSGIVYMSDRKQLLSTDSEVDEMAIYGGVNLWQFTRDRGALNETGNTLGFSKEPTGIGYDPAGKRIFVSDDDKARINEVLAGADNRFGTTDDYVGWISTTDLGNDDAEDVTYDTESGDLFIAQGVGAEVWRVSPGVNGRFDGVAPLGDDQVSNFDVGVYGIVDLEGIGYSPTRDSLFLADRKFTKVVEVTKTGALVQTIDVAGIDMDNPAAITLAPATIDHTRTSLYVVTRGEDNDNHPDENDGMMYEISAPNLQPTGAQDNTAPTVSAGPDSVVTQPASAILRGTVGDDGFPDPPGFTTESWSVVSGPGTVTFGDEAAASTTASFSSPGTYVLRLTSSDTALAVADDVVVEVNPQSTTNTAPSVFAGNDQLVTLPGSASLTGFTSDDGLPAPPGATTVTWSKVSGPGTVSFSAAKSLSTLASFNVGGTYVLRLSASDSKLSAFHDITVVVRPALPSGNLVKNPGFEVDTSGWKGSTGVAVTQVATPRSGNWSGSVSNTTTATTRCTLNDSPNWMTTSQPGTYTMRAWVRGDSAGVGSTVKLATYEYVDGTRVGSEEVGLKLTTGWQKLELTYVPTSPGTSWLDYNVVRASTPKGAVCFLADDLSAEIGASNDPVNVAPTVSAGADTSVVRPASASLDGMVVDDGLPNPPGAVSTTWSKVSGPGAVSFGDPGAVDTVASFAQAGSYVLRLTANDGALSSSDDVTVTVTDPVNVAPVVDAGGDRSVVRPESASLNGTVSDDGLPSPPGAVSTTWSKVSGPGAVTFGDAAAVDTTASFAEAGEYVLRLTADDGGLTSSDTVTVSVTDPASVNVAPVVDAGGDALVELPQSGILDGTVSDDGLPTPPGAVTTTWSKVNGPGAVTFGDPAAVDTTASFAEVGQYVLRLTAADGALTSSDEVTLTVLEPVSGPVNQSQPVNQAPVVDAGGDALVELPQSGFLNGTVSDDGLPTPPGAVTTTWSKVSGPGAVTFGDPSAVDTIASFMKAGTFVLRLTADDGGSTSFDEVTVTVTSATKPRR